MPQVLRKRAPRLFALAILWITSWADFANCADKPAPDAAKVEFFEKKIRPLLVNNCYACHSADTNSKGGLRVDDRNGLLAGGGKGAAVVPGSPEKSLLFHAVTHAANAPKMPPEKQLSEEEVADLKRWIVDGAAWPAVEIPEEITRPRNDYEELRKSHWSWQPRTSPKVPEVKEQSWPRSDLDRFVLARLEAEGLQPNAEANRLDLLRRVTFDLTGLPPTPDEIQTFLSDSSNTAFETVVDRLLSSSAFGEHWGRHWLDVARFGESTGSSRNLPYPHAWRYRDYVLKSFQDDKPFYQFIREQIAGDLLPAENEVQRAEQLVATGFLAIGVKDVNQRFKVRFIMDNIDEQIDAVSRAFLGLTASCARCHDHKFDPIPTADYYALAGIFHSTDLCAGVRNKMGGGGLDYYDTDMLLKLDAGSSPPADVAAKQTALQSQLKEAQAALKEAQQNPDKGVAGGEAQKKLQSARQRVNKIQADIAALNDPAVLGKVAFGLREGKSPHDTEIRIRGEAEKLGPVVPRGFLGILSVPDVPAIPDGQSGRLQLAQWLSSEQNPLTSRVIVNRIWGHLFGAGIVQTVDNFGTTGDKPSHPELLDHLAERFVQNGWSVKKLVREIVLSRSYQLSADNTDEGVEKDPANRLVWRHSPRRLTAEEIRDSMLVAADELEIEPIEGSAAGSLRVVEINNNGAEAQRLLNAARDSRYRSVYLPLVRGIVPTSLEAFDFAEQGMVTGQRDATTVAPQALYLLNDPLVRLASLKFAERLWEDTNATPAANVHEVYLAIVGRPATSDEITRAVAYIADYEALVSDPSSTVSPAIAELPGTQTPEPSVPPGGKKKGKKKAAAAAANTAGGQAVSAGANPDEVDQSGAITREEKVEACDARLAAWASFIQALYGSAEFRYLR